MIYFLPLTDWAGRPKKEMERRIEEFECAEAVLLVQTFNGIRQKLMARELVADAAQIEKYKKSAKTAGAPPVFLV